MKESALESPLLENVAGYIDGRWVSGDGKGIVVLDPATGAQLAEVPSMGRAQTLEAIASAERALEQPSDLATRAKWLRRIVAGLEANEKEIGRIVTLEHGKPWPEACGEVAYAAGFFRYCADHIDELAPRVLEERPRGCTWAVHYRPAGVAALLTPWNFPIGMIAKKLSASLAAGCPSIVKPSSKTPLTMIALFSLLHRDVELPPGMASLLIGPAGEIADTLCEHPAVRVVSFTGSTEIGKQLAHKCADGLKRLTLELGGNAPFVVFEDADLERAADQLMANKFRGGGQTCVCANRVFVQRAVADRFVELLSERVRRMRVGNGLEEGIDLGPLIDRAGFDKVARHVRDAEAHGARVVATTDVPASSAGSSGQGGHFHPPTVLRGVTPEMACFREETFGPLVPLVEFDDEAEAVSLANQTEFGLAAYVFTGDEARAERVIARLHFGHVGHNTGTGPTPEAPFGGMKQSGYGREGGLEGLLEFAEAQTVPRGG